MKPARIDIWHNILWASYKGEVFSALDTINDKGEFDIRFFQIAETEGNRIGLGDVDLAHHRYPYTLLFKGSYDSVALTRRVTAIAARTLQSGADLTVITGYEKPEAWAQLLIVKMTGRKAAVFCDSTLYDQKQSRRRGIFKTIFFKSVDGIFGYGQRSRAYALHYGAAPRKIFQRRQAAALPLDYTPEKALAARLAAAPAADRPYYLYVGRLSPEKGIDTLIDAFTAVARQFPAASLVIIGSGAAREALAGQARGLGLGSKIAFYGSKSGDALFTHYAQATALILPSLSEPWGLVVNEALSFGCPAIVSDRCGCTPELVIDGKTGFIHTAGNAENLAEKMLAAPTQFANTEKTARDCLNLIADYTPGKAAQQIIAGCRAILAKGT